MICATSSPLLSLPRGVVFVSLSLSSAPPRGSGGRCAGGRGGAEGGGAAAVSLAEELGRGEALFPGLFLCIGFSEDRGGPRDAGGAPDLLRRRGEVDWEV